jgi:hypothetical protein
MFSPLTPSKFWLLCLSEAVGHGVMFNIWGGRKIMSKVKVSEDINNLLSSVRDYISDAITQLDSARDKIAFLDLDFQDPAVEGLTINTKLLFANLQAQKRKIVRILNEVES